MIFTTYWFFAFTALCVLVFWLIPTAKFRLPFLAIACLVFHGHFAGPAGMAPIVVLMVVTFFCGLARSKAATSAGIVICVLALCFYKYTVFAVSAAVAPWLPQLAEQIVQSYRKMSPAAAPLGISFFVFEFVHYLVEVRRGGEPIRSPLKFLLFSIFFPSLVAGPIKRYQQFTASLEEGSKRFEVENLSFGLWRIALGFIKKVAIADNLTVLIGWNEGSMMSDSLWERWLFVGMVGLRILMDFSGYSDIAIGTARLLGVRLPENFNWPYAARSLQDFWQRWHISLSSWIRDYVYIPLGGNRLGPGRRIVNGVIAFALCGLWHGPAWNFVVWGLLHGVGLAINATYRSIPGVGPAIEAAMRKEPLIPWALTQMYVFIGWLFFFYPVAKAAAMTGALFRL